MTAPTLLTLHGDIVLTGSRPTGNQVQFRPRNLDLLAELPRGEGARVAADGTVRLRLDGLDAPEVDYDGLAQPFAGESRNALLERLGFRHVCFDGPEVTSAEPATAPVLLLARRVDASGRLRAFAFAGLAMPDGEWSEVDHELLGRSINASLLREGFVYLSLSESIARIHSERLRDCTRAARKEERGIWGRDATREFTLVNQDSLGPEGQLVLPRVFRRASLYLRLREHGETLPEWLKRSTREGHTLDDEVLDGREVKLSDLLEHEHETVRFREDPTEVVFVETSRSPALRAEQKRAVDAALADASIRRALEKSGLNEDVVREDALQALAASGAVEATLERAMFDPERALADADAEREPAYSAWIAAAGVSASLIVTVLGVTRYGASFTASVWTVLVPGSVLAAWVFNFRARRLVAASDDAVGGARRAARERVIREAALPEVRASINRLQYPSFSRELSTPSSAGLDDLHDSEYDVVTTSSGKLEAMFARLSAGSFGISGDRGAGKSTLLRRACDERILVGKDRPRVGVLVAAPVRYEAAEFVPFLFASLCLELLQPVEDVERRKRALRAQRRATLLLWLTVSVAVGLSVLVIVSPDWNKLFGSPNFLTVTVVAIAIALATFVVPRVVREFRAARRMLGEDELLARAREELEHLRWSESRSEELSSELNAKVAKIGGKSGVTRSAKAVTLPELIHRYRRFVARIAEEGPVIIGIDELDKMASTDDARRFLNDIKTLFGMPRVFNLVSLSDDAMSEYERRGLPIRDVLDSVFDEILRVEYLTDEESERLLRRRVIGMPAPFAALAHTLSGGLPREMLRVARQAVRASEDRSRNDLAGVAAAVIGERVAAREAGAAAVARHHVTDQGGQPILSWLRGLSRFEDGAELLQRCDVLSLVMETRATAGEGDERLELLILQLASFCYHAATVLQFFEGIKSETQFRDAQAGAPSVIDRFAEGYRELGQAPQLAWRTISDVRVNVGLEPLDYPLDLTRVPHATRPRAAPSSA